MKSAWQASFPTDPLWNLRTREVVFGMLNCTHRILRDAGLFFQAETWGMSSAMETCDKMRLIAKWAVEQQIPQDLADWVADDWQDYLDHHALTSGTSTLANDVRTIRFLRAFAPILSGGGLLDDPWPGRTAADVAQRTSRGELSTPEIPPAIWWPLMRAAWFYIDQWAPQILERRDQRAAATEAATPGLPHAGPGRQNRHLGAGPHQFGARPRQGLPRLSRRQRHVVDAGPVDHRRHQQPRLRGRPKLRTPSDARQGMVQRLVDAGRARPITAEEGRAALGDIPRHVRARNRRPKELDAQVRAWRVRSSHRPLGQSCD
ncbi:hypothetical protein [Streptomyces sp. NPDC017260]|uniref:hypothetical protein n=1 Tax=unclassified Streptomyces TaxID=2593676 RepID=UPI0037BBFA8F